MKIVDKIIKHLDEYRKSDENWYEEKCANEIIKKEHGEKVADMLGREFKAGFQTAINIIHNEFSEKGGE